MRPEILNNFQKHLDEFKGQAFDYVLTVCDNANESCPVFPGHSNRIHKGFVRQYEQPIFLRPIEVHPENRKWKSAEDQTTRGRG